MSPSKMIDCTSNALYYDGLDVSILLKPGWFVRYFPEISPPIDTLAKTLLYSGLSAIS